MMWLLILQLAMWEPVKPPVLHQGSWQSCLQDDGTYAERVLEHTTMQYVEGGYELPLRPGRAPYHNSTYKSVVAWELHLGPRDEFALYDHKVDGEHHTHDGPANKLAPAYRVSDLSTWRGKRTWSVASLHLWVSIVNAGGSRDECKSFYIRIEDTRRLSGKD